MKLLKHISIISILCCSLISNSYSQCGGGTVYDSYTVNVDNLTNCDFDYSFEAGDGNCVPCGGASGVVGANSGVVVTAYNCNSPGVRCLYLNHAIGNPLTTGGCSIDSYSEDYNTSNCGGTPTTGVGNSCCVNSWDVVIVSNTQIEIQ